MMLPTVGWLAEKTGADGKALSGTLPLGPISIDTRTIQAGDTFWALAAGRDGHSFVAEAFRKGAKAAVVTRAWQKSDVARPFRDRLIAVDDTLRTLTQAAETWRTGWRFPVLGITGSNGKTSTKDLTLRLLAQRFRTAGTQGNFNNEVGVPLTLLATPADSEAAVVEMGASQAGDIWYLCRLAAPTHGLVTSIGRAHLQGFGDLETVARTKGELYDWVAEFGTAFVPTDDPLCLEEAQSCRRRIGYGFQPASPDWRGEFHAGTELGFDDLGHAAFTFEGAQFELGVPGRPAAISALAALTVALSLGISATECRDAVRSWPGTHGRQEVLRLNGIVLLDDSYNANPTSMRAALETLALLKGARRVVLLGQMNELGAHAEAEHRRLGADLIRYGVDAAVCVGLHAELTAAGAREAGVDAAAFPAYEALQPALPSLIRSGDAVLVKGSRSMRLERAVQQLKELFA